MYSDQVIFLVLKYEQKERLRLNTAKPTVSLFSICTMEMMQHFCTFLKIQ